MSYWNWFIESEMWKVYEIIISVHTQYRSQNQNWSYQKCVLKARYRYNNMTIDIKDFCFKCQVWEIRISKYNKKLLNILKFIIWIKRN